MFSIKDTVIIINNKKIDFKKNINNVLESKGIIIVHIYDSYEKNGYINTAEQPINNVYALDNAGNIKWNVKDVFNRDELVTGISKNEDGNIIINTFHGVAYTVDVINQAIIGKAITK